MASYVILEPPRTEARGERFLVVRDGFRFLAFLVPFFWLLWFRMWIEAALVLAAVLLLGALGELTGLDRLVTVVSLLLGLFFGLEGANLRIAMLRRRGWREWGVVEAPNRDEAEIRYLTEADGDDVAARSVPPAAAPARPKPGGPALGLFGYPN